MNKSAGANANNKIDFISMITNAVKRPEVYLKVVRPFFSWLIMFVIAMVLINFFTTVAAIALVLYFCRSKNILFL